MKHAALLVPLVLVTACAPWVVRPIGQEASGPFDAQRYVDSIWTASVLPATNGATDLAAARAQSKPSLVKGHGKVTRVDRGSRAGVAWVRPDDGGPEIAIQLGPVLRGTALRDSLPFIDFSNFLNQLDFARTSNALNERAAKTALADLPAQIAPASGVTFTGAYSPAAAELLPVKLTWEPAK